jgi:hypothetical protein
MQEPRDYYDLQDQIDPISLIRWYHIPLIWIANHFKLYSIFIFVIGLGTGYWLCTLVLQI